ncbi:MAG: hypothetical protein HOD60_10290 [Candidatus Nitrosopelagicus sp.]|nr:hypothetical protein [Candidatus Nitrosopelagicus sp.]
MTRKCCKNKAKYLIEYYCGLDTANWQLCQKHYDCDTCFQKNIKNIEKLK